MYLPAGYGFRFDFVCYSQFKHAVPKYTYPQCAHKHPQLTSQVR